MQVRRHFIDIGSRRVHYRSAGSGPPLLMVHQSPRSSWEYEDLIRQWAPFFTCIAPDSPGFGQSSPLPGTPEIDDFADAIVEFLDSLGIEKTAAYGFHSGGTILATAVKRHPSRFLGLAVGGYAIWTPEEQSIFGRSYLPPFLPSDYGEHLTWAWNRILEQTWFFPWFDVREEARMSVATDDPFHVHAVLRDLLESGDFYRAGYGAVLRAPREVPSEEKAVVPTYVIAYEGDPLKSHLERLGKLPSKWSAKGVDTPQDLYDEALGFLRNLPHGEAPKLVEVSDTGFLPVEAGGFSGLIRWRGARASSTLCLHAPGRSVDLIDRQDMLAIDLPGHGLSSDWKDAPPDTLDAWATVILGFIKDHAPNVTTIVGEGWSALLAAVVASRAGCAWGGIDAHIPVDATGWDDAVPSVQPDRFGLYLTRAWSAVRAGHFFWPWFKASARHAIPFDPVDLTPEKLAVEHLALMRARSGEALMQVLARSDRDRLVANIPPAQWEVADWTTARDDLWSPLPD